MNEAVWSYDLIADVYATDMGRSMPFDDVGWYARVAAERAGRVLELGCGTGRITIELAARGLDVLGVDRSLPMLKRARLDAKTRGMALRVAQMDLRALALRDTFATILLPYSLVTYITEPDAVVTLLRDLKRLLAPDGRIVLDAFIPRPVTPFADFRRDYRREHDHGFLEREKRIAVNDDGTSTIERRYRLLDADDRVTNEFTTVDRIRAYAPETLASLARGAGYEIDRVVHDYAGRVPDHPQFCSVVLK